MNLPAGVSDILPLTPAQRGMLFHVLETSQVRGRYVAVLSCTLTGPIDAEELRTAMTEAVQVRDAYRAGFVWQGVKEPVQVINKTVSLPWVELDWRGEENHKECLDELIRTERLRQFDLVRAPLMAATLIQLEADRWQLVWTIHHLISDGWSTAAVLRDIFNRYQKTDAPESGFADFKDYLIWLRKHAPPFDEEFWKDHIAGIDGPCEIPRRVSNAPGDGLHGHLQRELGPVLLEDVNALARRLKLTTNTVLSAAWALVLRKLLQQDEVIFGQTFAGRPAQITGIRSAAGAFINTLPLRVNIEPDASAEDLLRSVAKLQTQIARHEFDSLAEVQACAGLAKGQHLFDTLFVNEALAEAKMDFGNARLSNLETIQSSNYALALLATPHGNFKTELYFDTDRCDASQAKSHMARFEAVLRSFVEKPASRISDLDWHDVPPVRVPEWKSCKSVVDRFLKAVRDHPEAPAVTDMRETVSYGALFDRAKQVAGALRKRGVGYGDVVPVALNRGTETIAGFFGVMMAGAAYVPIDPDYPTRRIAQIFEVFDPKWIVTSTDIAPSLTVSGAEHVLLDEITGDINEDEITTGDLAYVIFTSGSQGRPKGVEITHDALAHSTAARDEVYGETPGAFLMLSSFAFDSSVAGLYWTLATGGHLVIAPGQIEQEPRKLGELIRRCGVTHTLCLPSLAQLVLKTVPSRDLQSLRTLIAAGETFPPDLAETCGKMLSNCRVVNEYGPTETTVWCTVHDATQSGDTGTVPIGKALPGTWVGVCDRDGVPVPDGEVGEITVAGPTLARGYLSDPESTALSFARLGPQGPRAYRTGDLGRVREDGAIDFLGRRDEQLKIRGHRIELSEIELAAEQAAARCNVAAVSFVDAGRMTVALFLEHVADAELETAVREKIAAELPDPFHPSRFIFQEVFPKLPNGKINRRTLAEYAADRSRSNLSEAPQTGLERQVADLFSEILNLQTVSRNANFFECGGDSLLTLAAHARGRERGLNFDPADLFDHPTVAGLARCMLTNAGQPQTFKKVSDFRLANPDGKAMPVFILHGTMGLFYEVARGLDDDHPVGLSSSQFIYGGRLSYRITVSELADQAVDRLRVMQPQGPYVICAYSAACPIALEITRKLNPGEVDKVFMIDPPYLVLGSDPSRLRGIGSGMRQLRNRVKLASRIVRHICKLVFYSAAKVLFPRSEWLRTKSIQSVYVICLSRYRIPVYPGPVQVLLTDKNPSMVSGDVMDTHLESKEIVELDTLHRDAISSPDGILSVASRIVSHVQAGNSA